MSEWIKDNIDPDIANYLFNLRLRINDKIFQKNVMPDLSVDFELLEEQLQDTPQMIAFWNQILAEQSCLVQVLDRRIRNKKGQIWEKTVADANSNEVAIRSTDIKEIINADQSVQALEIELLKEKKKEDKIKAVIDGLIKKFDALRSLSGFKRDERRVQ